jgi:K(+)-stimulated pyrophosphate-energized sodium pump
VSGLFVVSLSLLGVLLLFLVMRQFNVEDQEIPLYIVGYGFGASFVALFAQLGGGIYTKAADVGADLVGKVEAGIPEDDPRNPAVIADLVGDNVGDCAGRGADLFESTAAENIGAMILAAALPPIFGVKVIFFPLIARAFGLVASVLGIFSVKLRGEEDPMQSLNRGYFLTVILAIIGFAATSYWLLRGDAAPADAWWKFSICGAVGVLTSLAFVFITQYYTEYKYRPVRDIAEASTTGPATNVIAGIAVGLETAGLPSLVVGAALIASYLLGVSALEEVTSISRFSAGLFGTAVATMGMLGTAAYVLSMDTFGPITDNAGGIVEMSGQPESVRERTDRLDSVGNTTKALTKGYAIGSAGLAAFLLFSAYIDEVRSIKPEALTIMADGSYSINISSPMIFVAGLLGGALVFVFASLAIRAVGKAASFVIQDVRAQFKESPGILAGTQRADYARTVSIVTDAALRQMILPGLLAVGFPILLGLGFRALGIGAEAVAAFLIVGTIVGMLMASLLNNGGGAWDNAKKYVETGAYGGKKSETHKATVVGDTVGDPFKDTAGPSLHVLIKLLATVTLVMAPLFV